LLRQNIVDDGNLTNAGLVTVQIKISEGLIAFYSGDQDQGITILQEAVKMEDLLGKHGISPGKIIPAREFLAEMFLETNKPNEALKVYEANLVVNPNRFNGIYGAAIASDQAGDQEKANRYFEQLLILSEGTNSDRPEIAEAIKYTGQSEI